MDRLLTAELEYVCILADELSFTAAAARLGMAQPALSRAVARIERRVGVALFTRTSRRVELTGAGRVFSDRARALLDGLDDVVVEVRERERARPLVVALRSGAGSGLLAVALTTWARPAVRIHPTRQPLHALRGRLADLAVVCASEDVDGLHVIDLSVEPTVALMATRHPLAVDTPLRLADVRAAAGFRSDCPDLALEELVDHVALSGVVVLAAADVRDRLGRGTGVCARVVDDAPATLLCAVSRPTAGHPAVRGFEGHLRRTARQRHPADGRAVR